MAGLASGMDTDSMVEQILSGTQNKIHKQEGSQATINLETRDVP